MDPGSISRNATIPDAGIPLACDNPTGGDGQSCQILAMAVKA
jgi:hypothetical protein